MSEVKEYPLSDRRMEGRVRLRKVEAATTGTTERHKPLSKSLNGLPINVRAAATRPAIWRDRFKLTKITDITIDPLSRHG